MTLRQRVYLTRLLDRKASRTITALQVFEPIDGYSARPGGKLQQSALLLRIPCANDFPEVLHHFVAFLVTAVVGVLLPVINIDIGDTPNQEFELPLVEDIDQLGRNELVEAGYESIELFFDAGLDLPLCHKSKTC